MGFALGATFKFYIFKFTFFAAFIVQKMKFAACSVSLAPVRAQPSDRSEMVTQLLFGETCEVVETAGSWRNIRCTWDGYEGWIDTKQVVDITPSEFKKYASNSAICLSLMEGLMAADHFIPVTLGASLPEFDGLRCRLAEKTFQFSGTTLSPMQQRPTGDWLVRIARRYLHAPYLWGGRSPFGIDCSGLTQMVYKIAGIPLLRDASQQVTQGETVDFLEQSQAGDLAFFDSGRDVISHVGILLPGGKIIHSSGKVRMDRVDHFGIFNVEFGRYTHQLRVVKRLLPPMEIFEKTAPRVEDFEEEVLVSQLELSF